MYAKSKILIVHFFNYTQEKDLGKQRKAWGSLMRFCLVAVTELARPATSGSAACIRF
jgi:hypothetical protein